MKTPRLLLVILGGLIHIAAAQDGILIDELSVESNVPLGAFSYPDTLWGYYGNPLSEETISGFFQVDILNTGEAVFTELAGIRGAADLSFVSEVEGNRTKLWIRVLDAGLEGLPLWVAVSTESGRVSADFADEPSASAKAIRPVISSFSFTNDVLLPHEGERLFDYSFNAAWAEPEKPGVASVPPETGEIVSDRGKTKIVWLDKMEIAFERLVAIEGREKMEALRNKYANRPKGLTLAK